MEEEKKEIVLEMKDLEDRTWKSCCLEVDRKAVVFFSTLGISLIMIAFCIFQLTTSKSCEAQQAYMGLLTLVLGIWIKSPSFN
jgi:hypothetical protein